MGKLARVNVYWLENAGYLLWVKEMAQLQSIPRKKWV
jgi:hypothetical protein